MNTFYKWSLVCFCLLSLLPSSVQAQYDEKYRPQFHFSPEKGWIGDPDGLVFSEGKYHLFWWGHAVSKDLVHWKQLPYPMKGGSGDFAYFSGSVVVDKKNTSGFGKGSMIAVYTRHFPGDSLPETQALSISHDGIYFHYYEKNPVLDINEVFFRDPQVFRYEPGEKWVMVVSLPDVQKIHLYESTDMKNWSFMSEFGGLGAQNSFWECPDLVQLTVNGNPENKKWAMFIGRGPNRVQYFLGNFDGEKFTADKETKDFLNEGIGLKGILFEDFENGLENWKIVGTAFQNSASTSDSIVHLGNRFVFPDSSHSTENKISSPYFTIQKSAINFLMAGGKRPEKLTIELIVDGEVVRSATGDNSNILKWNGWDVSDLKGKKAQIQIRDDHSGKVRGHILIDHIMFSNVLRNQQLEHALWLDYGSDFYAARTYRNYEREKDKKIMLGWMGNWSYANDVPTTWGKGFESIPRTISIKTYPEGNRIVQKPIEALKKLRKEKFEISTMLVRNIEKIPNFSPTENIYEIQAVFNTATSATFGFNLLVGDDRKLVLSYNPETSNFSVDRTNCTDYTSNEEFNKKFQKIMHAPVATINNELKLHIFVDKSSVEIFINEGRKVFSVLTFPAEDQTGIEVFSKNGQVTLKEFSAWELASIWKKQRNYNHKNN